MIKIRLINCNQGYLDGPLKVLNKLYKDFEVKHPNAWQIRMYGKNGWDGLVHFISENAKFKIGLLQSICNKLDEYGESYKIIDERQPINIKPTLPKKVGKFTPRKEQIEVINKIINNNIGGIPFYIGVQNLAVNFGKSLIMASIHLAFHSKLKTLILTNDADWLNQAKTEFTDLITKEPITFIQGSKVRNWSMFSIGMVQSLSRNVNLYINELSKVDILLIDECDLIDNKTYKNVIQHLYNTRVRLGLSGTIYLSKLKKDLLHNMTIRSFLGDELTTVRLEQMIKVGYSTPVIVKIIPTIYESLNETYMEQYNDCIINNNANYKISLNRCLYNISLGRKPAIICCKYIEHCESLYKFYKKYFKNTPLKIKCVHHKTKDRDKIIDDFRKGKIDILISTTIIARGKNFPLLAYLQNAADLDSNEKIIQIMGRLVRTDDSKKKAYLDDIAYNGKYLLRHSRHRINYYKKQNIKTIKLKLK